MNLPGLNLSDLTVYHQHLDLVKLTAEQLIKDFDVFGFEITFSGNNKSAYQELSQQVIPVIEKLLNKDFELFLSLLYKIDLNEKHVTEIINNFPKEQINSEISHLIIERELKKVVIRQYFKNQQNQG